MRKLTLALSAAAAMLLASCAGMTETERGALTGAAVGGAAGGIIGDDLGDAAIGAAVGAGVGGYVGCRNEGRC